MLSSSDFAKIRDKLHEMATQLSSAGELDIAGCLRCAAGMASERLGQTLYDETTGRAPKHGNA